MAARDLLQRSLSHLRRRAGDLRTHLLADEVAMERGGARGWSPQPAVSGLQRPPEEGRRGRDPSTGSPQVDVPFVEAAHLPGISPDPERLATLEAGAVWDVSAVLREVCAEAAEGGRSGLLLAFTLGHCRWSDRLVGALDGGHPVWGATHVGRVLRAGDRLAKVYYREIRLGDVSLTLPTLPVLIHLRREGDGLVFASLAMDPLGDPAGAALERVLAGQSVVAEGADHLAVVVCRGGMCFKLDQASGWGVPFGIGV